VCSGLHCGLIYLNLTAALLVLGVMDVQAMAATMAAITAERLAAADKYMERAIGFVVIGVGLISIASDHAPMTRRSIRRGNCFRGVASTGITFP
jgi:hypothetical protein